jgi:transposase-like protein
MVFDHRNEYPSEWGAFRSLAEKFGTTPETLRQWVCRAEVDGGRRSGVTSEERERLRQLERENRELQRAK